MPGDPALALAARRVHRAFAVRGGTLALAESCTGGIIAAAITGIPGSSSYFWGSAVAYANDAKSALALVDPAVIAKSGAVSRETADALALGIMERSGAAVTCGVTGIAGPGGAVPGKPVGTVHIAVAAGGAIVESTRFAFRGGRARVRRASALAALGMIERAAVRD